MDIWFNLLLIVHLGAFALGITTTIAAPIIMGRAQLAPVEARPAFGAIGLRLGANARIAFVLLVLSGAGMIYQRYGGFEGQNAWFWAKMALVTVIAIAIVLNLTLKPGTINPSVMGWITRLSMAGIIVSAVFAFN